MSDELEGKGKEEEGSEDKGKGEGEKGGMVLPEGSIKLADGRVMTAKEVVALEKGYKELQGQFTGETTSLARKRKAVEDGERALLVEKAKVGRIPEALRKDLAWYQTHTKDPEAWDDYEPETFKVAREVGLAIAGPTSHEEMLIREIKELKGEMQEGRKEVKEKKVEADVDGVINGIGEAHKEYPGASLRAAHDWARLFHFENDRLPNATEVKKYMATLHEDAVEGGWEPPRKKVDGEKGGGRPSGKVPPDTPTKVPPIGDRAAFSQASDKWWANYDLRKANA